MLKVSSAREKIIPQHIQSTMYVIRKWKRPRTKTDVRQILDEKSTTHSKNLEASEVKVTVMSFQNLPEEIPTI